MVIPSKPHAHFSHRFDSAKSHEVLPKGSELLKKATKGADKEELHQKLVGLKMLRSQCTVALT